MITGAQLQTAQGQPGEHLVVPRRSLVFFVDDTGHEELVKGHPVYGLGGCAVMGRDLDRLLKIPWRRVREHVTGSPDTPLHANTFPSVAKPGDIQVVADFFHRQLFWRFGAILTVRTKLINDLSLMRTMKSVLENRINEI